ncbi:MAG: hypothetical protein FJ297_03075 [Planctomycetes bacterium]|nr:hypothetical protein [Planctomycetota bacterium]
MSFHPPDRARRRPPNYSSRAVQFRLFVMVGAFVFVLVAMEEARKPKYYEWLWRGERQGRPSGAVPDRPAPSPRADSPSETPRRAAVTDPIPDSPQPPQPDSDPSPSDPANVRREAAPDDRDWNAMEADAWSYVVERLTDAESADTQECLFHIRHGAPPENELADHVARMVPRMATAWRDYDEGARNGLNVPVEERGTWIDRLDRLHARWHDAIGPALERWSSGRRSESDTVLSEWAVAGGAAQRALDVRMLELVQDNTVFLSREAPAWFRLLERLAADDPESAISVTYPQLVEQPESYRGRRVRVTGEIREARRVAAQANPLGIESYAVLWFKPDGANAPMVAYAADLPREFPNIADARRGEPPTPLRLEAEFTGTFFKLLTYRARRGVQFAPMLLVTAPTLPARPPVANGEPDFRFVLVLGALAGVAFTGILVHRSRSRKQRLPENPDIPMRANQEHGQ